MRQPKNKNEIVLDYEMSHARFGWDDIDSTSNPDPAGGSKTTEVNGENVPVRYIYFRAVGGDATAKVINRVDLVAKVETERTFYDGVFEPGLFADDEVKVTSGTIRAYYADPFFSVE